MTRFARAKGSKASNLKSPEDSTPWEVMKEHMLKAKNESEENKKREEAEQQRIDNYNKFLKERRVQKRKATWCDFPEAVTSAKLTEKKEKKQKKDKTVKNVEHLQNGIDGSNSNTNNLENQKSSGESEIPKKKKKKHNRNNPALEESQLADSIVPSGEQPTSVNNTKKNKKNEKKQKLSECTDETTSNNDTSKTETKNIQKGDSKSAIKRKNKQKKSPLVEGQSNKVSNGEAIAPETKKPDVQAGQIKKEKNKNMTNDKPNRRKPINDKSFQLIINGKEVKLVRYDGFPIMKKDADRLEELKQSMVKKGIPKSEVQRTMKLERRRAEKALARLKRDVCYNCRKGGHNLSDCPDLKTNIPGVDSAEGVCFKCGSTEHRQFECKVQRDKEFRFATCFICKESGHIARQCPDNPKGLYPNGGCCKLCGDVTHLRKDCPTVKDKKEEKSIKLSTLNDDNIEDIGYQPQPVAQETSKKPKKIKF